MTTLLQDFDERLVTLVPTSTFENLSVERKTRLRVPLAMKQGINTNLRFRFVL